jgi:hypothetical protein
VAKCITRAADGRTRQTHIVLILNGLTVALLAVALSRLFYGVKTDNHGLPNVLQPR